MKAAVKPILDTFDRKHNYLRISLIDKCNLRCQYCMPNEKMKFLPASSLMTASEIVSIAKEFTKWGVDRIRLTGGEPLIRPDLNEILAGLSALDVELNLTTNAYFLNKHMEELLAHGVQNLNISLDTLNPEKFVKLTKRDHFDVIWQNILSAKQSGFAIKLNVVLMKDINDDEILDFAKTAVEHQMEVRFIEFMPFQNNNWDRTGIVTEQQIIDLLQTSFSLEPLMKENHETSRRFKVDGKATIGLISSITNPFCDGCNRIRLTADGKLKNCLFSNNELDLLTAYRQGKNLESLVRNHMMKKFYARGGKKSFNDVKAQEIYQDNRQMIAIGG